jgi:hypothetical protein
VVVTLTSTIAAVGAAAIPSAGLGTFAFPKSVNTLWRPDYG